MISKSRIKEIDALLPQTQCRKCGFSGCEPYATAIAEGRADINQCPPGGMEGIRKLAELLGIEPRPLNTSHGIFKPRAVARIDEQTCIGCTLCIKACPVDAIVGAAKRMHTVISAECTGCELCVAPCPMDCIQMVPVMEHRHDSHDPLAEEARRNAANTARLRYQFRVQRLERQKQAAKEKRLLKSAVKSKVTPVSADDRKKAIIQTAMKRAMAARAQVTKNNSPNPHESSEKT